MTVNNFPVNTTFNSVTFASSGFRLNGNPIILGTATPGTGYLTSNLGAANNIVNLNLVLGGGQFNRQFVKVEDDGADLTVTGRIFSTSPVELSKDGPGTLVLRNDNSGYTGTITIVEGAVRVTHHNALGSSSRPTIVLSTFPNSGQLQVDDLGGLAMAEPLILNGPGPASDGVLLNVAGTNFLTGAITLDADSTIASNAGALQLQGVIRDTSVGHNLTKEGPAVVVLDPLRTPTGNVYRGQTFVNNGILQIRHSRALGAGSPTFGFNGTVVNSFPGRSGTLQLSYVPDARRIDPSVIRNAAKQVIGFRVPLETLTLNGPGFEGVHVRPKEAGVNGRTVSGALNNASGDNAWTQNVRLWTGDGAAANVDPLVWKQPELVDPNTGVVLQNAVNYSTVGIGAEANTSIAIEGRIDDDSLTAVPGSQDLTRTEYALIKTRPGRVIFVSANTYRGRTEVLQGFLNIRDSQALGTTGSEQNGTYVFPNGSLELEADRRNDSKPGGFSPDGRLHLATDIVFADENLFLMGVGANGAGSLRNIRGTNEFEGAISLMTRLDRGDLQIGVKGVPTGVSFRDRGASVGVEPDTAPFTDPFFHSQLTLSGVIQDGTFRDTPEVRLGQTYVAGTSISADLFKVGGGELVLSGDSSGTLQPNTYTGVTYIQGGWITARNDRALGGDQLRTLPILVGGKDLNGQDIPQNGFTQFPETRVAFGAALHLKRTRLGGLDIDLPENLWLSGQGITHRFAELNQNGALLNLSGDNTVSGDIQLFSRPGDPQVGIGVDLDPFDLGATVSQMTMTGKMSDTLGRFVVPRSAAGAGIAEDRYRLDVAANQGVIQLTYNFFNIPDRLEIEYQGQVIFNTGLVSTPTAPVTVTVPFGPGTDTFVDIIVNRGSTGDPGTVWEYTAVVTPTNRPAGVDKHGKNRLILQGPGDYSGAFNVREGTVRVQSDTALGVGYKATPGNVNDVIPTTTTVQNGAALEFAGHNPAVNGGVGGGIQVSDRIDLFGTGLAETQRVRVRRAAPGTASFRLVFGNQVTRVLPFGATAAQVQAALNALPPIGAGGVLVTLAIDALDGSYYYTITFQKNLVGADRPQITGGGTGVAVTSGTPVQGGARTVTNLSDDNTALGPVNFNSNVVLDTGNDSRLSFRGDVAGPGGLTKVGRGKMVLAGENSFAGNTVITAGIVSAQSSKAFGLPSTVARRGGTVLLNDASIEVQNDVTIGGEALEVVGNGPNSAPNIQPSWLQLGGGPTVGGQTGGAGTTGTGNTTGRVTSVATDPIDPNVYYITSASGGAWRTKDGGLTWEPLIDHVNDPTYTDQVLFAGTVAVAPSDPRVIYVGLGNPNHAVEDYYGKGILKSIDGGKSWRLIQPPGAAFDRQTISQIVVDPTNADVFYVTVEGPGVNGFDPANPANAGNLNLGIWRFNPALAATFFRPAVAEGWVDLTAPLVGTIVLDDLNRFTDLTVINVNPYLSNPFYPIDAGVPGEVYPNRPEYRMVTFAVGDPTGHDLGVTVAAASNSAYLGFFTDFSDVLPGSPGIPGSAADTAGWTANGFPNGDETIDNIVTPRNGMIKLTGVRPTQPDGNAGRLSRDVRQFAFVSYPVNLDREFLNNPAPGNNDGRFRQLLSMTATYNPAPTVAEWGLGGWGDFAPAIPGGLDGGTPQPNSLPFDNVRTNQPGAGWYANALVVSPAGVTTTNAGRADATRVFVAGVGQPFTNGPFVHVPGATPAWNDVGTSANAPHVNYHGAAVDPLGRVVVATDGGVWRLSSMAADATWENINGSGLNIGEFTGLDVDPFNPNVVIGGTIGNGTILYNGSSYSRAIDGGHGGLTYIHPKSPNLIYHMRNNELVRSTDGGKTWTVVHTVTPSPVYNATGGTNFISYTVSSGLPYQYSEPHLYPYMLPNNDDQSIFGSSGTENFPDYTSSAGFLFVVDPFNPSRVLVVQRSVLPLDNDINILQETLFADLAAGNGQPLTVRTIGEPSKWFPDQQSQPFSTVKIRSVALARFEGAPLADPAFPDAQNAGPDSYDPNTIYVLTNFGLFVTKNGGSSWARRDAGLPTSNLLNTGPYANYGDITVDPTNRNVAYIVRHVFRDGSSAGQVFRTSNGGQTWVDISGELPDLPAWKVTLNSRNGDIYLGNDNGVYRLTGAELADGLTGGGFAWARYGEGLPNVQVKQVVFNAQTNTLTVGTFGRGVFTMFLDDNTDDFENNRFNRGAIRSITGTSVWKGNIQLNGATDVRAERDSTIDFLTPLVEFRAGANLTLNKTGPGRVILSAPTNIGGAVNVLEGALRVDHPAALGSTSPLGKTVVSPFASLELQTNLVNERVELLGPGRTFNGQDTGALRNVSNNNTFTGVLTLRGNSSIGVESGSSLTIGARAGLPGVGVITQAVPGVGFTKEGTGTLILGTANNYTGSTFINEGLVVVTSPRGLGPANSGLTYVRLGAALQLQAPPLPANEVNNDGTIKNAATAPFTVVGEELFLEGTGIANSGALIVIGAVNWQGPIILVSVPPFFPQPSINVATPTSRFNVIGPVSGTGGLVKVGPARMTLTQDSTYEGVTIILAGALRILTPGGLGAAGSTGNRTEVRAGGALELLNPAGMTVADEELWLAGAGLPPVNAGALTNLAGVNTWTGPISLRDNATIGVNTSTRLVLTNDITDVTPANLTKRGLGQLVLEGLGSYNGATVIAQGDVQVNGTVGNVVLAGGTLSGSGAVGQITVSAPNGLVAVGDLTSPTAQLETNSVTWRPDVRFVVNLNDTTPGSGHDKLVVNGNINLNGAILLGTAGPAVAIGDQFTIIETVGGTVNGTFAGLPNGSFVTLSGKRFRVLYLGNAVVLRRE
ncbi:MAG: autotransporter-associated beta strand repeat-containing protein [Gemmataceae bacterium]